MTCFARIVEATRDRAGLSPEAIASDEDFWFDVQQAFIEDRNIINLNHGTIQPGLRMVHEAVRRHVHFSANAGFHSMSVLAREIESVRRRLALHLGCDSEELVIRRGGTEAGQIPILGLDLKPGDEVVTTNQDYPRLISTWRQREKREGIVLKIVPLPVPPVAFDDFYQRVEQALTPCSGSCDRCDSTRASTRPSRAPLSLSVQEIDYFGDVLEDIARTCELR